MRLLMASVLVAILVGAAAAQEKSAPSVPSNWTATNVFQFSPQPLSKYPGAGTVPQYDAKLMVGPTDDKCYFIRSYIFEHKDGSVPVLKGETVCTSSNANAVRRAHKGRKGGLVPLTLSQ